MQTTNILSALFLVFTLAACSKTQTIQEEKSLKESNLLTFSYAQTQCADPWPTSTDDNITAQNVKRFLDSAGVAVSSVNIKKTALEASCLACTCPSGKIIYVTAPNSQEVKARITELKFN